MVGFTFSPTIKEEEEEAISVPLHLKKPNSPLDLSLPELEDFSASFTDSFLNFDGWIEEKPEVLMADFGGSEAGDVDSGQVEGFEGVAEEGSLKETPIDNGSLKETPIGNGSGELKDLGCLIGEEMGRVSLEGVEVGVSGRERNPELVNDACDWKKNGELPDGVDFGRSNLVMSVDGDELKLCDKLTAERTEKSENRDNHRGSEPEAECTSMSSSLSSSSSSSEDDRDEENDEEEEEEEKDDDKNLGIKGKKVEDGEQDEVEVEEGEIRDFYEGMVAWSGDEEDVGGNIGSAGPVRSKNEVQVLPPVPPVNVTIQPHHQTLPVGVVSSILGIQVIVEGLEKHNPLSEGSILWITESRSPLGLVDEIFGPVRNPYYLVRYNSESEVPKGICQGCLVSFVPEFAEYVLNNADVYKKGYDASGENDEELSEEAEFSDDEKEAEYKRMHKVWKRGSSDQKNGISKKGGKEFRSQRGKFRNESRSNDTRSLCPSSTSQAFSVGPGSAQVIPPAAQAHSVTPSSSVVWTNEMTGLPPQNLGFPSGLPAIIPCIQPNYPQQPYQMPLPIGSPFFQQFGANQILPNNFVFQAGQPNLCAAPTFLQWQPNTGPVGFDQSRVATNSFIAAPPVNALTQGVLNSGLQVNSKVRTRPPFIRANGEASESSVNRVDVLHLNHGGRRPYQRGRGRFRGGRGGGGGQGQ